MRLKLLGTGDAYGIPVYGCHCHVCEAARKNTAYRRGACCAVLEADGEHIRIDAGLPELADMQEGLVSGILLTHFHPDHVLGLFRLRWGMGPPINVYCPPDPEGCADLYKNHGILNFKPVQAFEPFMIGSVRVTPVPLNHSKLTFGYGCEWQGKKLAYLTDTVGLPEQSERFLASWHPDTLVIDCSHPPQASTPRNHNDLNMAIHIAQRLEVERTLLTHIGHEVDTWLMAHPDRLPDTVDIARDGYLIEW